MNDLWEEIKKYAMNYKDNGAYIAFNVNAKEISVWKEGYENKCYYRVNADDLLNLGFDSEVLANMVYLNFLKNKDLDEKADN